jgi:hypothetical protein
MATVNCAMICSAMACCEKSQENDVCQMVISPEIFLFGFTQKIK